jgi:hypothetical protein
MTRALTAAAVAIVAALAYAAPALGATPFTAGTGTGHDLAVGSDGFGHAVWIQNDGTEDDVAYCRVPPGATACDGESTVLEFADTTAANPDSFGTAQVLTPAPGKVVVVASCTQCGAGTVEDRTYSWLDLDNGASFGAPVEIGQDLMLDGQVGYLNTGDIVLGVEATHFLAMNASVVTDLDFNIGGFGVSAGPAAVPGPVATKVVHALNDNSSTVRYAVFNDPALPVTEADLNTPGNWDTMNPLAGAEPDNEETHLSSGATGVLLSYLSTFPAGDVRVGMRFFDSVTDSFGAPVYVQGTSAIDDNGLDFPHHSQDAGNRIHFVWRTLHDGGRLRYTRSEDGGTSFSAPANLALGESFQAPLVEAGAAGTGFAAWRTTGNAIRIVPIDPQPEPAGPVDPGAPGSPGSPGAPAGPGGPAGAGGPGGTDTTAPTVGGFGVGDSTLLAGAGSMFSFNSSEAGRAVLTFRKRVKGLKAKVKGKRRCVPQTKRRLRKLRRSAGSPRAYRKLLRKRRCKTWKRIGEIRREVTPGRNEVVFTGRIAGRRLSPGLYQARLVITDGGGNVSRTETLRFRVVKKKRRGRVSTSSG